MNLEQRAGQRLEPIIPESGRIDEWKNVYFHTTQGSNLIPILKRGLWSVAFSRLPQVNQPIADRGFSPVQEEVGWDWISVLDSDYPLSGQDVSPEFENVTLVLRKLPFKSKPAVAERSFRGEHLIHWRQSPRDIVAVWVDGNVTPKAIDVFLNQGVFPVTYRKLLSLFRNLSSVSPQVKKFLRETTDEELAMLYDMFPESSRHFIQEMLSSSLPRTLARKWIEEEYALNVEQNTVKDLLKKIENETNIPFYEVKSSDPADIMQDIKIATRI